MLILMQKKFALVLFFTGLVGSFAWAVEAPVPSGPPISSDQPMTTTGRASDVTPGQLSREVVGIKPQIGALVFKDQNQNITSRMIEGLTVDGNIATMIDRNWDSVFIGPSVGVLFSHLGNSTSNFIGLNSDPGSPAGGGGANLLMIPANLKFGFNLTDNFRLTAHGGGNALYRSLASSMSLGDDTLDNGPVWKLFPNVGADAEIGLGKNIALMLRPDWTVTPGDVVFSGTLALSIPLI